MVVVPQKVNVRRSWSKRLGILINIYSKRVCIGPLFQNFFNLTNLPDAFNSHKISSF